MALSLAQCHQDGVRGSQVRLAAPPVHTPIPVPDAGEMAEQIAGGDPLEFLRQCRAAYDEHVDDYRCVFTKQERIGGTLRPAQVTEVKFRERPYSVAMRWLQNAGGASQLSYVEGRRVKNGREYAHIYPSGLVALLAPGGVWRDIHGPEILSETRRSVDCFGFRKTLDLMIEYCERALDDSQYDLKYVGKGSIDGRPCFVLERRLPYSGDGGAYPDRLAVIYIDQEWLLPTAVYAYGDDAARELLGSYVITDVEFNVGLTDAEF